MFTGALLFIAALIIQLGVGYEPAPSYVEASDATKPALLVVASTLDRIDGVANDIGLLVGIGMLLFALAILRTSIVPKWVGWLGLPGVMFAWLSMFNPVMDALGTPMTSKCLLPRMCPHGLTCRLPAVRYTTE